MKLFVYRPHSPNPNDWSIWDEPTLILAYNKQEALQLLGLPESLSDQIYEIQATQPCIICKLSEPNHGNDI